MPLRSRLSDLRLIADEQWFAQGNECAPLGLSIQVGDTLERLGSAEQRTATFDVDQSEEKKELSQEERSVVLPAHQKADREDGFVSGKIVKLTLSWSGTERVKPPRLKRIQLRGYVEPVEVPGGPSTLGLERSHQVNQRAQVGRSKIATRDMYSEDGRFVELTLVDGEDEVGGFTLDCTGGNESNNHGVTQRSGKNAVVQVSVEETDQLRNAAELSQHMSAASSMGGITPLGRFTIPGACERQQVNFDLEQTVLARRVTLSLVEGPFTLSNVAVHRTSIS